MANKCPICFSDISDTPDPENFIWSDDPILTTPSLVSDTDTQYKGFIQIKINHITELQDNRKALETQLSITPLTVFTDLTPNNIFQIWDTAITQLRDSTEKLLDTVGMTKEDYFNFDSDGTDKKPGNHQLDWTDVIDLTSHELCKFQIKGMHIEDLRHFIQSVWENFNKPIGTATISVVGQPTLVTDSFVIQKNQLWGGAVSALREFYNSLVYKSSSRATATILNVGTCFAQAKPGDGGAASYPGFQYYWADARASAGLSVGIPVINYATKFPLTKTIYNPITQVNDLYHLWIKASCSISTSISTSYVTGETGYIWIGRGSFFPPYQSVEQWNDYSHTTPTDYVVASAEVVLSLPIFIPGQQGFYMQLCQGTYHNRGTTGSPTTLTNFNIDLAQKEFDLYGVMTGFISQFNIGVACFGQTNTDSIKISNAILAPYKGVGGEDIWLAPFAAVLLKANCTAQFTIDNINFYYKKV